MRLSFIFVHFFTFSNLLSKSKSFNILECNFQVLALKMTELYPFGGLDFGSVQGLRSGGLASVHHTQIGIYSD